MEQKEQRVILEVANLSNRLANAHAYVLTLKEKGNTRKMSLLVGSKEAQAILYGQRKIILERPLTYDLFYKIFASYNMNLLEVEIYKIENGLFYAHLVVIQNNQVEHIDARAGDALALALRMDAPVFIEEKLFSTIAVEEKESESLSLPITSVTMDMLQQLLKDAVEQENYESASRIRDEIKRREASDLALEDDIINL
jgi:bifunctional DNase/RNase